MQITRRSRLLLRTGRGRWLQADDSKDQPQKLIHNSIHISENIGDNNPDSPAIHIRIAHRGKLALPCLEPGLGVATLLPIPAISRNPLIATSDHPQYHPYL